MGVTTLGRTNYGICSVEVCTDMVIFYKWPEPPGYSTSFTIPHTWNISCSDNVECSYNDMDPHGTFGAWITRILIPDPHSLHPEWINNGTETKVCLNGACLVYEWWTVRLFYMLLSFQLCITSFFIYIIMRVCSRAPRPRFDNLYAAIASTTGDRDSNF